MSKVNGDKHPTVGRRMLKDKHGSRMNANNAKPYKPTFASSNFVSPNKSHFNSTSRITDTKKNEIVSGQLNINVDDSQLSMNALEDNKE